MLSPFFLGVKMRTIFIAIIFLVLSAEAAVTVPFWNGRVAQYEKVYLNQKMVLVDGCSLRDGCPLRDIPTDLIPSGRIFVRLAPSVSVDECIKEYPVSLSYALTVIPEIVILRANDSEEVLEIAMQLQQDSRVLKVEPAWEHQVDYKRELPNDPYMSLAWHLFDDVLEGDASVVEAWDYLYDQDITPGRGVVIGIIDDGFDLGHQDLFDNFARGYDFENNDEYPLAHSHAPHGTAVTGVAAARGWNGIGVVGGCPYCTIVPVRMDGMNLDGASEVEAFDFLLNKNVDIISNSWGPMDNAGPKDMPEPLKDLVEWAAVNGRNGKGTVILFAAGNGNESISDEKSFDGYAAHPDTIAVGAVNRDGFRTFYSDFGKDLDIVAPSCDIDPDAYYDTHVTYKYKNGIPTTDIRGVIGYRIGDYAPLFCGTSAATPLAASIVALMFSANYDLTLKEVREIMHTTADKVSPDDALYDEDEFSVFYGYGRINALKSVERACQFGCVSPEDEADLERYAYDELPTPVDHNGKMTTMTDEDSIIPPAVDGCSILLLP